jgi:hypothetical protein
VKLASKTLKVVKRSDLMLRSLVVSSTRNRITAALTLCALGGLTVAIPPGQAETDADCDQVEGTLREQVVGTDPVQTRGRFKGDIRGAYSFVVTGGGPSQTPDVAHFDGRSEVQTKDGKLFFSDAGAISSVGRGNLAYLSTIRDGSGDWEGATGQLLFRGFVDPATGRGKSDYVGEVCTLDD